MNEKDISKLAAWKLLGDMSCSKCVHKYGYPLQVTIASPKDKVKYRYVLCLKNQNIPMTENSFEERFRIIMTSRCERYLEEPDD